jgi:hypothetical protein
VLPAPSEICGNGVDDNCDGQVDEGCDPFDDASCTGSPLSLADISARLGSGRSVDLAPVQILSRSRACTAQGCGSWNADGQFSFVRLAGRPPLPYAWAAPLSGIARLGYSEINPNLALQVTSADAVPNDGATNVDDLRLECFSGLGTPSAACRSWAEYWRNGVIGPDMAPSVFVGDEHAGFSGIVADHCLRLLASGSYAQASGKRETQVVVFARY